MAKIMLVTGGCRSGKSAYAERRAMALPGRRAYVATCPVVDEEMARRIAAHRRAREGQGWVTIEEPTDLEGVLRRHAAVDVLLIDCLTLWINNLLYEAGRAGRQLDEPPCRELLDAAEACRGWVIFVTNEVGLGIVPDSPLARRYRDLVGRANQLVAQRAEEVVLMCCGIPLMVKAKEQRTNEK
jgi:adenosylcobinamide kinase/adenosylcobinamide-phosphate guanylyltransferase